MTSRPKSCPICKQERREEFSPFCSSRCRDRDLVKWLDDGYAIPAEPIPPDTDLED